MWISYKEERTTLRSIARVKFQMYGGIICVSLKTAPGRIGSKTVRASGCVESERAFFATLNF
jgi:hypothetical protein